MKRLTTLLAVMLFALIGAPLAALAEEKGKADANANSNAQSSEDANKGQERAAERHDAHGAAKAKVKTRGELGVGGGTPPIDEATSDAKAATGKAKSTAEEAAEAESAAKTSAEKAKSEVSGKAKAASDPVSVEFPDADASPEAEAVTAE